MRALLFSVTLLVSGATVLAAQRSGALATPSRPALPRDADTCDANAYYRYGLSQLRWNPEQAAAAFYWTQRLSPNTAVGYYAERIALLMEDPYLLRGYVEGDRRVLESEQVRRIDSLQVRALTLDPFFPQLLDETLILAYFTNLVRDELRRQGSQISETDIEFFLRQEIESADPATRGWLAYGRGDYRQAADDWAPEVRRDRRNTDLRALRAHALLLMGAPDSARAELEAALAAARRSDAERMKYVYDSKVLWEYELGRIGEMQGEDSVARDDYQRALVEDLSFYPAHVRLAYLALRARDTAAAVTELQRAIEVKGDDYAARLLLGVVYTARRNLALATEQLRRAAEIEPWVAQPHLVLGEAHRLAGARDDAAAEYRRFLALAARTDPNLSTVRQLLALVGGSAP